MEIFKEGGESYVTIKGWIYRKRILKNKVFLIVRDSTGIIQVIFDRELNSKLFDLASNLNIESAVVVSGVVKREPRAPGGFEIHAQDLKWYSTGHPFPINEDAVLTDSEYLLDLRHLWIRSRKMTAILKIRHTIFEAIHEYFRNHGYYEVQAPTFVSAAVEGGATLFQVKYFDRDDVYLTQSAQFYLESLIYSLEKVYTVAPSFRAEPSRTRRHLTEFWHAEAEIAWAHLEDIMRTCEELLHYIIKKVLNERLEELSMLKRNVEFLENIEPPFPRITYDDAIKLLQSKGLNVKWGDDLGADEERVLTQHFDQPIHLYLFPEHVKAFYHKNHPEKREVTLSVDMLAPEGYGEIIGGGERIDNEEELVDKIRKFGLNPEDYQWYIDLRKYGSVPHAGFGLGIDRVVMWICGLDHIRDAVPFPRDIRRVKP